MDIADITPLLLTYNEEANIARTLSALGWASRIVVVDSGSLDNTLSILQAAPKVETFHRAFDSHAQQWNFALTKTAVTTPWVLALDADYILSEELIAELISLQPDDQTSGYRASFSYCINGQPLAGSLYPPNIVLFRAKRGSYVQDGHTQRLNLIGPHITLKGRIFHDDRKPLSQWLTAQDNYATLEARKISGFCFAELAWPDRLRKLIFAAPFVVLFYCLFWKGCVFQGRTGAYYALQRMLAELVLSLKLIAPTASGSRK